MHFHLPKPLHGWREFAGEVGIIVIGVLIALAAQQVAEWIHWQAKVAESEAAIGRDLAVQSDIASERVAIMRCQDDRLALLRSALLSSGDTWNSELPQNTDGIPFTKPYGAPVRLWTAQLWDSLVADGTVAHFDPTRARAYALLYQSIREREADNEQEVRDETALYILADKGVPLSGDVKVQLVRIIDGLRLRNLIMAGSSRQILRRISDSGHLPSLQATERRLSAHSEALKCRFAPQALNDRIAGDWLTLHR